MTTKVQNISVPMTVNMDVAHKAYVKLSNNKGLLNFNDILGMEVALDMETIKNTVAQGLDTLPEELEEFVANKDVNQLSKHVAETLGKVFNSPGFQEFLAVITIKMIAQREGGEGALDRIQKLYVEVGARPAPRGK